MTMTKTQGLAPEATATPLILDFLEWLAAEPRAYAEVMDVWRTSGPRLTIWEDAVDRGLIARRREPGQPAPIVALTPAGHQALTVSGRPSAAA
jgi:hypothetical protein